MFGIMKKEMYDVYKKYFDSAWINRNVTRAIFHPCMAPDQSSRDGYVIFVIHDIPLTFHQKERTVRNQYLITRGEQQQLFGKRIGFVGLSTGSVALESFLRQGIGGIYRLADFDMFEVSNSNRMLFNKAHVGMSKVDLCVERIKSVDPDVIVETFSEGLSEHTINDFVQDCDIIIEECDNFLMKLLLRHAAMKYSRPLLMATSQNGMIDVERYDSDKTTKPFHLADQTVLENVFILNLSSEEKVKAISYIFDTSLFSTRFLNSAREIGKSISSWPQLSEEVFLNAAILTHAARRILLGDNSVPSGRYSFDMSKLFSPGNCIVRGKM